MGAEERAAATPTSQIIRDLDAAGDEAVRLCRLFAAMGSRVHGVALLLLALTGPLQGLIVKRMKPIT